MGLPVITGSNPKKVDDFYKKLLFNVQSLETLGRLRDVTGNVRAVLEKLKGIRADLVQGQDGWQEWDFAQLIQALKRWREIYPVEDSESPNSHTRAVLPRTRTTREVLPRTRTTREVLPRTRTSAWVCLL